MQKAQLKTNQHERVQPPKGYKRKATPKPCFACLLCATCMVSMLVRVPVCTVYHHARKVKKIIPGASCKAQEEVRIAQRQQTEHHAPKGSRRDNVICRSVNPTYTRR